MKCKLEEYSRIYNILWELGNGYASGDFHNVFPMLAPDCILESQWVLVPIKGDKAIKTYLIEKGKTLIKSKAFRDCKIVEQIGCPDAPMGKPYLLLEQELGEKTNSVIVDIQIDNSGMATRIDLCMSELRTYWPCSYLLKAIPTIDDTENHEAEIFISASYFDELGFFCKCANTFFGECDDLHISMDDWCKALDYWSKFAEAELFDDAFEIIAGVDYDKNTIKRPDIAKMLGKNGWLLWRRKPKSNLMLKELQEWTALYCSSHDGINTYEWNQYL